MGDRRRHQVFHDFVKRNYPRAENILCVADGKGELARLLANKASVTCIDPKPRGFHKELNYIKDVFDRHNNISAYDLILGMHPDEATAEIILACNRHNKPFAIVPCCIKGSIQFTHGIYGFGRWLDVLSRLAGDSSQTMLKFSGKNVVVYRR